jgi:hypothetical protein
MSIKDLQEQLQENLRAYLDGIGEHIIDDVCQIVVDTCHDSLKAKYLLPSDWNGTVVR